MNQPVFLMSPPRRDWHLAGRANFRSREAREVDAGRARLEWSTLADSIVDAGGEVLVCPPNPKRHLTGLLYTAEAGEFYRNEEGYRRFLLPNMVPKHRRLEADWMGGFVEGLGIATKTIEPAWEAQGDAIRGVTGDQIIHTYGEGSEARTDGEAYREVADRLSPRHIQIRFDADPWFHGNTFMNVYRAPDPQRDPPAVLLICRKALADGEYDRLRQFVEPAEVVELTRQESLAYATNALQVNDTVLAPADFSTTASRALRSIGLKVVHIGLSELFAKGGGAPVCLTNRLWGLDADHLPDHARWSKFALIEAHTSL